MKLVVFSLIVSMGAMSGHSATEYRKEYAESHNNTFPELEIIREYLTNSPSPFMLSNVPLSFLEKLREKNERFLVRNGNLVDAEEAVRQHQLLLQQFLHLCDSFGLSQDMTREAFFYSGKRFSRQDKREIWHTFLQHRKALKNAFTSCEKHLQLMLSTELAIVRQLNHFPELAEHMNHLYNLDGSPLPIYIFSHLQLFDYASHENKGLAIMVQHHGLFTSDTSDIRKRLPSLIGKKEALAIHLKLGADGEVLSHEFGHLFYLYHHWQEYQTYIQLGGSAYEISGHSMFDPCGKAAELAENGIMPD